MVVGEGGGGYGIWLYSDGPFRIIFLKYIFAVVEVSTQLNICSDLIFVMHIYLYTIYMYSDLNVNVVMPTSYESCFVFFGLFLES